MADNDEDVQETINNAVEDAEGRIIVCASVSSGELKDAMMTVLKDVDSSMTVGELMEHLRNS